MASALEAKLIITAQDRTEAVIKAIMQRLESTLQRVRAIGQATEGASRALTNVGETVGRVEQSLGAAARTMEASARSMERAAAAMAKSAQAEGAVRRAETSRGAEAAAGEFALAASGRRGAHRHGHGRALAGSLASGRSPGHIVRHETVEGGYGQFGLGGAIAAYGAFEGGERVVKESAERQHERMRMEIAGMDPRERREAEQHAAVLAAKFPLIDQTSMMHSLRNLRGITGSYDEASAMSEDLFGLRVVAQTAKPDRDIENEVDQLLKGMEAHGDTQDRAKFHDAITRITKTLALEGDTLSPGTIYHAIRNARQALPSASGRFLFSAAPALMQDLGEGFGPALSSFNRAIVTGRMDSKALPTALDLGLIAKEDVEYDKHGAPVRVKPLTKGGHGFKDWRVAASDPDEYVYKTLMPALKAHGFSDPQQISQIVNLLLSNRMAGMFALAFATQQSRIEKNQANLANVPDDPAGVIMKGDPTAAWMGVKNAIDNVAAATDVSGNGLTAALNRISTALDDTAARMQGVKTEHMRQVENQQKYGISTSQDLSNASPADIAKVKAQGIADLQDKIAKTQLEAAGVHEEIQRRREAQQGLLEWLGFTKPEHRTGDLLTREFNLKSELAELVASLAKLKALAPAQPNTPSSAPAGPVTTPGAVGLRAGRDGQPHAPQLPPDTYGGVGLGRGAGPIEAQLRGSVDVHSSFEVKAASSLIEIVNKAQKVVSDSALLNAESSGRSFGMKVGGGRLDLTPAGRQP